MSKPLNVQTLCFAFEASKRDNEKMFLFISTNRYFYELTFMLGNFHVYHIECEQVTLFRSQTFLKSKEQSGD